MRAAVPKPAPATSPRMARFREAVAAVRRRAGHARGAEDWLFVAGSFLMPFGLVLVLLGWWGASRTPFLFEQIPYLISGGIFGAGLAAVGGLCYFAHWQARSAVEQRHHLHELLASIHRLEAAAADERAAIQRLLARDGRTETAAELVATSRGGMAHDPTCRVVAGRHDLRPVTSADALAPCRICQPTER